MFEILFVIFTKFCENNYNGIVRHLLKLFLENLEVQIKRSLNLDVNNPEDNIGYLLAIFESYMPDKKLR